MKLVDQALKESRMNKSSIDDIILVGESTLGMSLMLEKHFGKAPWKGVDPEVAIVHGAAIQADILTWQQYDGGCSGYLLDVYPLTLGK
jgi:molecular chaperone DnaK (HSP70)